MRESRILLVGLKGLHSEVCKNLVLAGVNSVTILENETVSAADLGAHLFLTEDALGKNVLHFYFENTLTEMTFVAWCCKYSLHYNIESSSSH